MWRKALSNPEKAATKNPWLRCYVSAKHKCPAWAGVIFCKGYFHHHPIQMLNMTFVSILVFLLQTATAPTSTSATPPASTSFVSHQAFEDLLQKHVSEAGKVNYKGLKTDKASLDAYCQLLSENPVQESWSREAKMAYWINAYNAFTIKLIVDNYPTKSILNFDGGKTWDVRRIKIGDKKYSLNNLENDILRPKFKDPRIHFAINCAAKSCPPLWNHAYTAENLESTLAARTRTFINDPQYNRITANKAQVSRIFEWYAVDFGDLKKFLNQYSKTTLSASAKVEYELYNWDLNE